MEFVHAVIELTNSGDVAMARRNIMDSQEIRKICLSMIVDDSAYMMAINEAIQLQLGLPFVEKRTVQLPSGNVVEYDVAGPVEVRFANRLATCNAFILPGDSQPILGAIPIGEMDVLIDPKSQELVVNPWHPEYAVIKMK